MMKFIRSRRVLPPIAFSLLPLFWTTLAKAESPTAFAIRDAHVVTVSGPELPKATVLIRDGLIEDVGPNLTIPADAWVINGSGLTVYPGFIDGLSTWGIPERSPATPPAGTPGTPPSRSHGPEDRPQNVSFTRAADLVQPTDKRIEMARAAGFTTAVTFPETGIFGGQGAVVDLAGERGADMVVASPIAQYVAIRTGRYFDGFPNSLMGVLAYVRQLYLDLAWHQKAMSIYNGHVNGLKRPPYDHYLEGLAESPRLLLPASQSQQIDRMIAFGNELKQPYVLYGLQEGFARIDELRKANIPVMVSLKWPVRPPGADPVNVPDYRTLMMRDQAPSVPGLLAKAGVRFGFFSDGLATAGDLRQALKKSLDAGLKREDAIRALTLNTAEIYGVSDRLGSVDRGKIANLVVTKGDAFDDKTPIEYVFVDGQEFQPRTEPGTAPSKGGVQ